MSADRCVREDELLDSLERGFVGPELSAHVSSCSACSELHAVAGALLSERAHAITEAAVPSAGRMWWRMQLRRQQDADAAARRSLWMGQAATLVIAIALMASFFGAEVAVSVRQLISSIQISTPYLIVIGTWLLLVPIAGWVAIRQK